MGGQASQKSATLEAPMNHASTLFHIFLFRAPHFLTDGFLDHD